MKKVVMLLCALALAATAWGQGKINTRKYILNDFNDKVVQIVLTGNDLIDSGLKQEVVNIWTASPLNSAPWTASRRSRHRPSTTS